MDMKGAREGKQRHLVVCAGREADSPLIPPAAHPIVAVVPMTLMGEILHPFIRGLMMNTDICMQPRFKPSLWTQSLIVLSDRVIGLVLGHTIYSSCHFISVVDLWLLVA